MKHSKYPEQNLNSLFPALRRRLPLLLFLVLYLAWVFLTCADYGMTFDESGVYARGAGMSHYLVHDDFAGFVLPDAKDDQEFYGHLYGMLLNLLNPSQSLAVNHCLNMLFALLLFIALYELILSRTGKPWLSLLGPVFLFLCPRFTGDIPANPKDMPFAVFYFLGLCGIYFFHRRPQTPPLAKALGLGLLFGLAQTSRMLGFTLYGVYLLFDFYFFLPKKPSQGQWLARLKETAELLALVFITSCFLMVATWPYLGANFFNHLVRLLHMASEFTWRNNVLFLGQEIPSTALPRSYLPVWLGVTTPLFLLFLLALSFWKTPRFLKNEAWILGAIALILNFGLYFLFKPVLYDGLRHFLFLLPLIVLLASLAAMDWLSQTSKAKVAYFVMGLLLFNISTVGIHLIRLHPYEYVYFNELIGGIPGSVGKFDNDYWGGSFKEAVGRVTDETSKNPNKVFLVNASGNPYQVFCYFPPNLKWTDDLSKADYYLSITRDDKEKISVPFKSLTQVKREGVTLNYVYRLK